MIKLLTTTAALLCLATPALAESSPAPHAMSGHMAGHMAGHMKGHMAGHMAGHMKGGAMKHDAMHGGAMAHPSSKP